MKTIKIKFVDFSDDFSLNNDFLKILEKKYNVEISDSPDYVFCSVFGTNHLKYDCVKIFYTGECITPNFNEFDYAIGFDRIEFGDRYLRMPLFQLFQYREKFDILKRRGEFSKQDLSLKTDFCNYVVSNSFVKDKRTQIFLKLCEYKNVNSGGKYLNNIGGRVKDKFAFQLKHKFSIAFENNSYDGYATEKIVDAFAAKTIPIYWGDPRIALDFNPKAFINCHDYNNLDDVVKRVIEIDSNDDLYLQMMNEPIVTIENANIESFLYSIFDQPLEAAYRRPRSRWTQRMEDVQRRHKFFEDHVYYYWWRFTNFIYRLKNDNIHI